MEGENRFRQLDLTKELVTIPNGKFWIGSDLKTSHDVTLLPQTSTTIKINVAPDNLPPNRRLLSRTFMSTRSIFMQLGIEVGSETPDILAWTLVGNGDSDMTASIPLTNVGKRTITIPDKTGVGSLYLWNRQVIKNGELEDYVNNGDIRMTGKEGIDWRFHRDNEGVLSGIKYRIDPDFRKYIPEGNTIDMADFKNRHDRPKIDLLLEDVPDAEDPIDWITQTKSAIGLSEKVHALIEPQLKANERFFDARHRNSLLLKGGDDWPIRLELLSPTYKGGVPDWILFRFAKAA